MPAIIFDLDETLLDTSMLRKDRTHRRWRQLAARLDEVRAYSDDRSRLQAVELPARVKEMGFQVGVLTHSPGWYAQRLLSAFDIPYDALITGSDGYSPKPDPSSLRAIADELGVAVEDCIMVGDDAADIGAAQKRRRCQHWRCVVSARAESWRRRWPDIAIARPDRLIDVLDKDGSRLPFAEAVLAGSQPFWHWGSVTAVG